MAVITNLTVFPIAIAELDITVPAKTALTVVGTAAQISAITGVSAYIVAGSLSIADNPVPTIPVTNLAEVELAEQAASIRAALKANTQSLDLNGQSITNGLFGNVSVTGSRVDNYTLGPSLASDSKGILAMWVGDSLTGTGGAAPMYGGSRNAAFTDARARGFNLRAFGRQAQNRVGLMLPYEPWCEGNAGYSIEDINALFGGPSTGAPNNVSIAATKNFIVANGAPDVICLMIGTNNVSGLGNSAATMVTKLMALLAQITSVCPTTRIIVETIPGFYSPSTPSGGIAAANATVATYNAWILANVPALNALYSAIDVAASLSVDSAYTDGMHLNIAGQAVKGRLEVQELVRLYPHRYGATMPRVFRPRVQQASVNLPTKGTSKLQTGADNGWRIPAGSFAFGGRMQVTDYTAGAINYIMEGFPVGLDWNSGFAFVIDDSLSPRQYLVYIMGTVAGQFQAPFLVDQPVYFAVHADAAAKVVSLWLAAPISQSSPGAPYVCACVGASTGVTVWAQGTANPVLGVGTGSGGAQSGVAGNFDGLWLAQGASLPGVFTFRDAFEAWVYEGADIPGVMGSLPCTEGTGTTVASRVGGAAGTITSGGWMAPGEIPWASDEDTPQTPTSSSQWATIAMGDANQVLPASAFNATTIEPTGALTADRNLTLPRRKGRILTINNRTTGAHNVVAIGASGTGVNCPVGITHVYWDGTNFVQG